MSEEKLLMDFSGGMNALAAVDKLDPKECLLAENVRFDETGDILSAGAFTAQNTTAYVDGVSNNSVHSLYWDPSLGAVAGVGQDVFTGPTLGGMTSALANQNLSHQKMSFASAPGRVYFDVGSVGYWTDMTNLLLVDWVPPSAGAAGGGFNSSAGFFNGNTSSNYGFALSTSSIGGIAAIITLTQVLHNNSGFDQLTTSTVQANLMVGGVAVGTATSIVDIETNFAHSTTTVVTTYTFGNQSTLWGVSLTPAQINASNFGIIYAVFKTGQLTATLSSPFVTAFQRSVGFVAGTGTTGTLTGTYTWKVTFVAANGEESDGSLPSSTIILSAQQGTLTGIPSGDARTTSRNIYRKGNLLSSYYLVGSVPDNTTTTFSDNVTDLTALTEGVILAGDVPGDFPNSRLGSTLVRFPVYHYDRLFWVNRNSPNEIIWSKPLNAFAYPVVNSIDVGDSKPITRLISIFGELIIYKTGGQIWRLTGTDESSFDLSQTPSNVSTDESFTIVAQPDKAIFANRFGFWAFNGYTSQAVTNKMDLWFKQLDRTGKSLFGFNGFHPPEVVSASVPLNFDSCGNSEKYYFAYAEAGQTSNNALLVFDLKHGNITKREPGIQLPLSLAIDPVNGYVYIGDQLGFVSLLDDWNGANAAGAPLNFDFQHGYQDFQRGSNKTMWALEFYLNTNGQTLTPYVYYDNGTSSEFLAAITTTGLQRVVRPLESTASRKAQNISVRLNGALSTVNVSGTPQIQVVHIKVLYDLRVGRARTGQ